VEDLRISLSLKIYFQLSSRHIPIVE
jgi:hypothetical protein